MIKLLTTLRSQRADNCFILTYNVDLPFFEYMLFDQLYANGCRNTVVVCDPLQYEVALQDTPLLRSAGQRYLVLPARISPRGVFHPKLALLTSATAGSLFLASGNLSRPGYTRNWEVVSTFEYNDKRPDPAAWIACRWAFDTLARILSKTDAGALGLERIEQLKGTTRWIREEYQLPTSAPVWLLHNLDEPLLKQLLDHYREKDGSPVKEIVVISPFFDAEVRVIAQLLAECRPASFRLYTQGTQHGLSPRALRSILDQSAVRFQVGQLDLEGRRLHAKTLLLRTEQGAWIATGSANLSAPAWLHRAAAGNTELISLRFEPKPEYFDPWLGQALASAHPLDMDWTAEAEESEALPVVPIAPLTVRSAILQGNLVALELVQQLPSDGRVTIEFAGQESCSLVCQHWHQERDGTLALQLALESLSWLRYPTVVALEVVSSTGILRSNPVLLNNAIALRNSSRPVVRTERPDIPEGMEPQSYVQCVQLLDMLHDLLATNIEQLWRHRGQKNDSHKHRGREEPSGEEEDPYNPQDHIVDETVRRAAAVSGGDLYVDFYDRQTYEEVLRAILAAAYHPLAVESPGLETEKVPSLPSPVLPRPPEDPNERARLLEQIERGFARLVGNIQQGVQDEHYMAEVPLPYLAELLLIIMSYLRIVWRDKMLTDELFLDHSLTLLDLFWGGPGRKGAWQIMQSRDTGAELDQVGQRLSLNSQIWLHCHLIASLQDRAGDDHLYDLAATMRQIQAALCPPSILENLPEQRYQWLWQSCFPPTVPVQPQEEVVAYLQAVAPRYDDVTLQNEISARPGAHVSISEGERAGVKKVPILEAELPLVEEELDQCWHFFQLFLRWPQIKRFAWVRFENSNPLIGEEDVQSVTIIYRGDMQTLDLVVRRPSEDSHPRYHPDISIENVTAGEIGRTDSIKELASRLQ